MSDDSPSGQQSAPAPRPPQTLPELGSSTKVLAILLICAFAVVLASSLTLTDFWSSHEGRVASVARNMLGSGDWWVPMLNGVPRLEKGPLVYWVVATSGALWGQVNEFSARLPSLLVGMGCVLVTILIGRTILTNTAALLAGLFQIATFAYWRDCRTAELDLYLTFFICLAMLAFCRRHFAHRKNPGWILLFWIALGCGAATKNILTVLPAILSCALALRFCRTGPGKAQQQTHHTGQTNETSSRATTFWPWQLIGISLFVLLALAWNLSMYWRFGQYAPAVWQKEIHTVLLHAHSARPVYSYLLTIFIWAFPASVFVPGAFAVGFSSAAKEHSKQLLFLFLWMTVLLVAYSVWPMGKKKIEYIQPMLPAFVLSVGYVWNQLLTKQFRGRFNRGDLWQLSCHGLLISLCGLTAVGFGLLDAEGRWVVAVLGAGLVVLGLSSLIIRTCRVSILLWGTALAMLAGMIISFTWFLPAINRQISPHIFAQRITQHGGRAGKVALLNSADKKQTGKARRGQGLSPLGFYLGYDIEYVSGPCELQDFLAVQPDGLLITHGRDIDQNKLANLGLKIIYQQSLSEPPFELTAARLPQSWQQPSEKLLERFRKSPRHIVLLARDPQH